MFRNVRHPPSSSAPAFRLCETGEQHVTPLLRAIGLGLFVDHQRWNALLPGVGAARRASSPSVAAETNPALTLRLVVARGGIFHNMRGQMTAFAC